MLAAGIRDPGHRIERFCDHCRVIDTHPRHIVLGDDGGTVSKHMDCCDNAGCPDGHGLCGTVLRVSRVRGDALVRWLDGRMDALGADLDRWLKAGAPQMGGASGLDQNRVIDFLQVCTGYSAPGAGSTPCTPGGSR